MDVLWVLLSLLLNGSSLANVPPPEPAEQRQVDEKAGEAQSWSPRD